MKDAISDRSFRNRLHALRRKEFVVPLLVTLFTLIPVLVGFSEFVKWVEQRPGVRFSDPFLTRMAPSDLTWLIFTMIYGGLIMSVFALAVFPQRLLIAVQAYILVVIVRALVMYAMPLDPPEGMIPLRDPLVEDLGTGQLLTRDLFFSGHTATTSLLFFCVCQKIMKIILFIATAVLAFALLKQHVHYSVDVLSAPFFAYGAYRAVVLSHSKFGLNRKQV